LPRFKLLNARKTWRALNEHSTDYPDGAVFAKVGVPTEEDPAFIDSQTPMAAKRVQ